MSTREAYETELTQLREGLAANIRRLRKGSQEALSSTANLHRTEVGMIEQGKREPRLGTLLILAEALGVTLNDLAEGLPVPQERRPAPKPKADPRAKADPQGPDRSQAQTDER